MLGKGFAGGWGRFYGCIVWIFGDVYRYDEYAFGVYVFEYEGGLVVNRDVYKDVCVCVYIYVNFSIWLYILKKKNYGCLGVDAFRKDYFVYFVFRFRRVILRFLV